MFDDFTPRYAPARVLIVRDRTAGELDVQQYIAHPPGAHPAGCPLVPECTALELRTAAGSRWYGVHRAYINSELRMVVEGINSRDEVRRQWAIVPEECRV